MKKKTEALQFGLSDILFASVSAAVGIAAQALICGLLKIDPYICAIFIGALYGAAILTYTLYKRGNRFKRGIKPTSEVEVVLSESVVNSASPVLVCPADKGRVVWMNKAAAHLAGNKRQVSFKDIFTFEESTGLYEAESKLFLRASHSSQGSYGKQYTVYTMSDVTETFQTEKNLRGKETAIAYIVVDNLEELLNYEQDDHRLASAETDRLLRLWASEVGGFLKEYQSEKYIFVFECSHLDSFAEKGFDILDKIRDIRVGENSIPLTVSIGVSAFGATPAEKDKNARNALETALQRGGDQAVVKGEGTLDIYGGKTKTAQKRTKVKARAIANELISHITSAENVIIMFHKFADLDAFGSAVGIARLCMFCGVPVNIVADTNDPGLVKCFGWISQLPDYRGVFVDSATALDMVNSETLLIITDVSNKMQFESPVLYENCNNVVIIDHHRKTAEFEKDIKITYIEPAAAAASELVCEMLEQVLPTECLLQREADLMLAGILLDTNQFTKSTSTRTFSAALYLRGIGADVGEVQEFFKTDLQDFQRELKFNSNVEIYRDICAIAVADGPCEMKDKIPAAKAANRLLTVDGVKASFALLAIGDDIHISARSSGNINVQLILEELRGGGHFDAAGARIEGLDAQKAVKLLKAAIDKYLSDMENKK